MNLWYLGLGDKSQEGLVRTHMREFLAKDKGIVAISYRLRDDITKMDKAEIKKHLEHQYIHNPGFRSQKDSVEKPLECVLLFRDCIKEGDFLISPFFGTCGEDMIRVGMVKKSCTTLSNILGKDYEPFLTEFVKECGRDYVMNPDSNVDPVDECQYFPSISVEWITGAFNRKEHCSEFILRQITTRGHKIRKGVNKLDAPDNLPHGIVNGGFPHWL